MTLDEAKKWFKQNVSPEGWKGLEGKIEDYYKENKHFVLNKDGKVDLTDFVNWTKGESHTLSDDIKNAVSHLEGKGKAIYTEYEPKVEGWLAKASSFLNKNKIGSGTALVGLAAGAFLTGGASVVIPLLIAAVGFVTGNQADPDGAAKIGKKPDAAPGAGTPPPGAGDEGKTPAFDEKNPEQVKALQTQLNNYYELTKNQTRLEVNGNWNETKTQWLEYKKQVWTDGLPSIGYLKESIGLDETALKAAGIDPAKYTTREQRDELAKHLSPEIMVKIQEKLHVDKTGILDPDTQKAIKQDKIEHWTDDRVNKGAQDDLKDRIKAMAAAAKGRGERLPADLNPDNPGMPPLTPGPPDGPNGPSPGK